MRQWRIRGRKVKDLPYFIYNQFIYILYATNISHRPRPRSAGWRPIDLRESGPQSFQLQVLGISSPSKRIRSDQRHQIINSFGTAIDEWPER